MISRLLLPLVMLLAGVAFFAADVTGTWQGDYHTREGGTIPTTLTLKVDGSNLTGALKSGKGPEQPIENGTVNGDEISFVITYTGEGGSRKVNYTGKLEGDQLKLVGQAEGRPRKIELTLSRKPS
ncbi:MAG: hypothetical protein JOZ62_07625 [Acidobacteriaceae bacterium]|nr:hypothetical protein [Acidobacteriaceae bacterium]